MSEQLGRMLRSIPASLTENVKTDCVYLGTGSLTVGHDRPDVSIRVFLSGEGKTMASIRSKKAMLDVVAPFGTEEEQAAFPKKAVRAIVAGMN